MKTAEYLVEVGHWSSRLGRHLWVPGVIDKRRGSRVHVKTAIGEDWHATDSSAYRVRGDDPALNVDAYREFLGEPDAPLSAEQFILWRDATARMLVLGGLYPNTYCKDCSATGLLGKPLVHNLAGHATHSAGRES